MARTAQKATEAAQTFWNVKSGKGVFFTQQQELGARMWGEGGGKNRKIKAKRCGPRVGGPVEIR